MSGRRITLYIPEDAAQKLDLAAHSTGQSASAIAVAALRATDLVLAGQTIALERYLKAIGGSAE